MSTQEIIKKIAKENGVTPKQIENDIKEAIRIGMSSSDPIAQAFWKRIAPDGKEPSIDTLLKFCANHILKNESCKIG